MALEGAVRTLLEELKYRLKFPPRERIPVIKSEFARRVLARICAYEGTRREFT
jgi:hypothetical protein